LRERLICISKFILLVVSIVEYQIFVYLEMIDLWLSNTQVAARKSQENSAS